jgi:hypothetical protein
VPTLASLGVIVAILVIVTLTSLRASRKAELAAAEEDLVGAGEPEDR